MKLSQSNFNLWSPDSDSIRSYLIATVSIYFNIKSPLIVYLDSCMFMLELFGVVKLRYFRQEQGHAIQIHASIFWIKDFSVANFLIRIRTTFMYLGPKVRGIIKLLVKRRYYHLLG